MIKGSLQVNHGMFFVVISYKDEYGKPKTKWIKTGLKAENNKTRAKQEMKRILKEYEENESSLLAPKNFDEDIYFVDFLKNFLPTKKQQIEPITYHAYTKMLDEIVKYFKSMRLKLKELKPFHIEGFYNKLYERNLSSNSVLHYHVFIREALQYAFKNDLVNTNVADKVTRPKVKDFKASFYSAEEIEKLFEVIQDNECKLPIMLTAMYGFRRSEVVGLKWDAIDFDKMMVKVQHKVLETKIDGERTIYKSDKLKNKTSNRALPLLPQAYQLLIEKKAEIERNRECLGKCYDKRYLDYVCVDNIGRLILPNRLTHNFIKVLKKNNLRRIRFHDLRHSCASLMLANGVPMKNIQEWLGHANYSTTANIYSHLDYSSKINSANTISNVFEFNNTPKPQEEQKTKEELEKQIEVLQSKLEEQQKEDDEYQEWLKEREERRKRRKEKDFEM